MKLTTRSVQVFVEEGAADVPVGKPLAIIVEDESAIEAFKDYVPDEDGSSSSRTEKKPSKEEPIQSTSAEDTEPPKEQLEASEKEEKRTPSPAKRTGERVLASPLARMMAESGGVPLAEVTGSGPGGRVIAADIADALAKGTRKQTTESTSHAVDMPEFTDLELSKFRRVTAQRLLQSKQTIPHYYVTVDCTVDGMLGMRALINKRANGEYKISVNDFIIKAAAAALRKVPEVNSQWMGDKIRMFHTADISIAVQTEKGLITPIVKDADRKGLREISTEVKELATKAKENTLAPEEFMGGTFTISNLGMFGVNSFSAIVNPPQAAILAVGASEKRVVPDDTTESGFSTKTILTVTMSCDHRVVDGAVGAQWLQEFKKCIEDPVNIIM